MIVKIKTPKYIIFILGLFLVLTFLSGCSVSDYFLNKRADDQTLYNISDPNSELPNVDFNLGSDISFDANTNIESRDYIDEKTGAAITKTQYYAYHVTDAVKLYGLYITIPCFGIGFLMRRFVHSSAAIRKWGLVLELGIPFVYVLLAYVLSAVADKL